MRHDRTGFLWVAWVSAMVLVSTVAWAQEPPAEPKGDVAKAKVLPLRVSSNKLPAGDLAALTDAVVKKLQRYSTYDVMPVPTADPMDMMVDAGCTDFDADCLAAIGASAGADKVLYTEVSDKDGRFAVQVRLVDVKTKESKNPEGGAESREKLAEFIAGALEKALGPEPLREPVLVKVDIATTPTGAEVFLNKDFVGISPVSVRLKAGAYQVRVTKVGFKEETQGLSVEEGKPAARTLAMSAVEVPPLPVEPVAPKEKESEVTPFYATWWFWTVVGAVVVGTGVTAWALTRSHDSGTQGGAVFTPDPYFAPKDVTLYPRK